MDSRADRGRAYTIKSCASKRLSRRMSHADFRGDFPTWDLGSQRTRRVSKCHVQANIRRSFVSEHEQSGRCQRRSNSAPARQRHHCTSGVNEARLFSVDDPLDHAEGLAFARELLDRLKKRWAHHGGRAANEYRATLRFTTDYDFWVSSLDGLAEELEALGFELIERPSTDGASRLGQIVAQRGTRAIRNVGNRVC